MSNSICPVCGAMMDPVPGLVIGAKWIKCRGCGYMRKDNKRIIKPVGGNWVGPGVGDVDDFNQW